jgi:inner membrane protein
MAAVGAFGGLLADADTQASFLGRLLPLVWHKVTPGHRRITHSLFYTAFVFAAALGVQLWGAAKGVWGAPGKPFVPLALTAGLLSHLIADGLTDQGVPLFYPLWKRHFRLLGPFSFTTGTAAERVAVVALLSLAGGYVFRPLAKWVFGDTFHTPELWGLRTEPLLVFVTTVVVCALLLVLYSLSRSGKPRRRRNARSGSRRSPVRSQSHTKTGRRP